MHIKGKLNAWADRFNCEMPDINNMEIFFSKVFILLKIKKKIALYINIVFKKKRVN